MLKVCYSNKPEALAIRLQEDLASTVGLPPRDLFSPVKLIVASRPLETWLKHQLVPRAGIVANLETWLLRRFSGELVAGAFSGQAALDGSALRDLLLSLFLEGDLSGGDLAPVRGYLSRSGSEAAELRSIQLASQLSRVFEEYVFSRREMLDAWAKGRPSPSDGGGELAAWQRRLWQRVLSSAEGRFVLPTRLTELRPETLVAPRAPLFVFGLSFLGTSYHELLVHLAKAADVYVYTLNPCMEFWEDLESVRDRKRAFARKAESLSPAALAAEDPFALRNDECRPLALWGRPGREAVRLLNQASGGNAAGIFVNPTASGASLLRRLQADMLAREPARRPPPVPPGTPFDGIEIARAPSLRRECEFVAGRIWALLESKPALPGEPPLRLDEVAVLIAAKDAESYAAPLLNAFREHGDLPWQLVGLPFALTSPVVEAALLLLELPLSRFTRADLLRVLTHPVIAERFPHADASAWVRWVDELGIAHGASHSDHEATYIDRDILNWDQGLKRVALGAFLSTRAENDERLFQLGPERYLPDPAGRHLEEGAGALLLLARSLLADAQGLRDALLRVRDWAELLAALFSTYLVPRDDQERRALDACLKIVRSLAARELGGRPISFLLAKELVREELASAGASSGGAVTGGVRISTLPASRGIPARVTFIVGLSEGAFPASDRAEALDLRPKKPQAGDASGREKDEYLFLEALLCARDRLVLSYVARDERTGEVRNPSPVIVDLLRLLDEGYLGRAPDEPSPHPLVHELPLWRADANPANDSLIVPTAPGLAERRLRAIGASLRTLSGPLPPGTTARALAGKLQPALLVALEAALHVVPIPSQEIVAEEKTRRVSLSQLRAYLECPLQGSARVRLRLSDDEDEDLLDRADEVFNASARTTVPFLKEAFVEAWREAGSDALGSNSTVLRKAWERRAELLVEQGRFPAGEFLDAEREDGLAVLEAWRLAATALSSGSRPLQVLRFGPASEHERVEQIHDALVFHLEVPGPPSRKLRVELVGTTQPLLGIDCSLLLLRKKEKRGEDEHLAAALRGWLDRVVLAASGVLPPSIHRVTLAYRDGVRSYSLEPISQEEAQQLLETLLQDMLTGDNELLFPFRAVAQKHGKSAEKPFAELVEALLNNERVSICSGPVRRPESFRIPGDDEVEQLSARRFALLFDRVHEVDKPDEPAESTPAPKRAKKGEGP